MAYSEISLKILQEKWDKKRRDPDKRDAAEKSPIGEALQEMPSFVSWDENTGDMGADNSFCAAQNSNKP